MSFCARMGLPEYDSDYTDAEMEIWMARVEAELRSALPVVTITLADWCDMSAGERAILCKIIEEDNEPSEFEKDAQSIVDAALRSLKGKKK
jgi:hypothetical protein